MRLICSRCGRTLKNPAGIYAGHMYGRVCMLAMGLITVKTRLFTSLPRSRRSDEKQLELFTREAKP